MYSILSFVADKSQAILSITLSDMYTLSSASVFLRDVYSNLNMAVIQYIINKIGFRGRQFMVICPYCAKKIQNDLNICIYCGKELTNEYINRVETTEFESIKEPKKTIRKLVSIVSKTILFLFLGIQYLFFTVCVLFFLLGIVTGINDLFRNKAVLNVLETHSSESLILFGGTYNIFYDDNSMVCIEKQYSSIHPSCRTEKVALYESNSYIEGYYSGLLALVFSVFCFTLIIISFFFFFFKKKMKSLIIGLFTIMPIIAFFIFAAIMSRMAPPNL